MEFFPMFRAVREANKRNDGEARATMRNAHERSIPQCGTERMLRIV